MPQGSVLAPLLCLIYINDLPDNIQSTCKIFVGDTSLFSHDFDKHKSQSGLLLAKRLSFNEHVQSKMNKCCKMTGVVKRLSVSLPRDTLLRIYKSFIRPLWITKTLFMTNQITSLLKTKFKIFNIKLALQKLLLFNGTLLP